jgi:polyisoprenoid-binding protein YceI
VFRATCVLAFVWLCSVTAITTSAQGTGWSTREGDVRVQCPLTIGGSFEARTKMLTGTLQPGPTASDPLAGEMTVDLRMLDTGIELRNEHLRDTYLEVGKGPDFSQAVLSQIRLAGVDPARGGKGTFSGMLRLHGMERTVNGQAELRRTDAGVRVRASFGVSLKDFGIADPRYLGVGVRDNVTVQVTFDAKPS